MYLNVETHLVTMLTGTAYHLPFVAAVLTGTMHACIHVHCTLTTRHCISRHTKQSSKQDPRSLSLPTMLCISDSSCLVSVVFAGQRIACYWLRAPAERVMRLLLDFEEVRYELSAKSTQKRRIQDHIHDLNSHDSDSAGSVNHYSVSNVHLSRLSVLS